MLDGDLTDDAALGSLGLLCLGYDGDVSPCDPGGDLGFETAGASGIVAFSFDADEVDEGLFKVVGGVSGDGGSVDPFAGVHGRRGRVCV